MAEALVGGAFLSASLQVLFDRMASREFLNFFSKRNLDDRLVDKMKITLLALKAVLNDAEDKQITNPEVKAWLDELQHAVYRAEDLLDEIATNALKAELEAESQSSTNQVGFNRFIHLMKKFLVRINCFVSTTIYLSNEAIESRIKEVIVDLEYFVTQKDIHGLREDVGRKQLKRLPTTCLVDESGVYGRDKDKEKIIDLLLSDEFISNEIPVIPIVGMGGVGKTTLAQLVYNDVEVDQNFDMKAWVCVCDEFDVSMITKKIVEAVTASSDDTDDLNLLQIKLKDSLSGKKFLLVLDDVWNENYDVWDLLRRPFRSGAPKSRIIVTTRHENVAKVMRSVPSHHIEQLSFEDSWSLFAKHAFQNEDFSAYLDLEMIGKEIVNKCRVLPLAVKSLGGLLRSERDIEEWKSILESEMWHLQSNILPALRLSYHYLTSHLKRCFAYCSMFLKDHEFEKEELVQLWMAEGFVQRPPKGNKSMEDEGNNYFSELISRSFFQRLSGTNSSFVMHDLVHDLAEFVSGEFCFKLENDHGKPGDLSRKVRHFSYVRVKYDAFEKFNFDNKAKYLRTFISFPQHRRYFLSKKVLHDMLPRLRCLRVLSLCGYQIFELPQTIGYLIHLRYLDLSNTRLKLLPDSILTLCNLETLNLSSCRDFVELPTNFGKLINLHRLNVAYTGLTKLPIDLGKLINLHYLDTTGTMLREMPMQMSRLIRLRHLTDFVVGKDSGSGISDLKTLYCLRGKLSILELQNVTNSRDALEANFKDKHHLEELKLKWSGNTHDSQNESDVLDNLKPHTNLKYVTIKGFGGRRLPDWLGDLSFTNIVCLHLSNCEYCDSLPSLGHLSSLKHLSICGMKEVRKVGEEFYGDASLIKPFQSLEILRFENMAEWKEWHAFGAGEFSLLLELSLVRCPNLTGKLPSHFPCLRKIRISECQRLESDQVGLSLQHLSSLQQLKFSKMSNFMQLASELQNLSSLQKLKISNMSNLTQLSPELKQLHSLQKLLIFNMPCLKELPRELWRLINLEELRIDSCSRLVSFPDFALPPMLKTLKIKKCDAIQSLPEGIMRFNTCLEDLSISDCSSLVSFPIGGVPDTLKKISIIYCEKLEFPIMSEGSISIEHLHIYNSCDSLKSLSLSFFPKLCSLNIWRCKNFEALSLPDELQNLTKIEIYNCEKLKLLPQRMHTHLPSLQSLEIWNCPEVESFPDGGLPANICKLEIVNCKKLMKCRMEWGLQRLPSLEELTIAGECEEHVSGPFPEEWLLPTTLTSLHFCHLPNLKSLNHKGLQHLTSLQALYICDCTNLLSLPEEGLPNSLSFLKIIDCPLLKERYQEQKGKDWSTIARIRHIKLDFEDILNF
ncbi:putative disease resistance RPP13-like protein 1 [Cornus florida]|uniref:putative disease resistance RPP13-like protein 1 n=1 Tax=Cornus florida TaxID=4283 RepID=UPI002899E28B|nr:putative disease resistance RPP13-like protein 1 [Cornus florida]XP_059651920.1 putative disease resistance RPP13-like protein 1 [Cornus florida]XP_059651921.1 putative disease resistance RPP13-like protein 1 [Cornus florida]XP_059651922.1 putative disease resistance RPP13-like protein 1 [Cornus florida]XP_059651923.1 putative disease resistance RPP13-like protein 1 [Cornus florida]XP_059651924.1 putative disease resistance RPP13-like protein 1 [Cornus florida]